MQLQLQTPRPVMELGAPDGTAVWRHSSDSHAFKGTRSMLNHSKAGPRASVHLPLLRLREDADAQQACSSRDSSHSEPVPALKPPRRARVSIDPGPLLPPLPSASPVVQRKVSARFQPRESVFRVQHGAPEEGNPRAAGGWLEGGVRPSPRMANHHEWCSPAANAGQRRSYDGGRKWEFSLKADLAPRGIPMPQPMPVAQKMAMLKTGFQRRLELVGLKLEAAQEKERTARVVEREAAAVARLSREAAQRKADAAYVAALVHAHQARSLALVRSQETHREVEAGAAARKAAKARYRAAMAAAQNARRAMLRDVAQYAAGIIDLKGIQRRRRLPSPRKRHVAPDLSFMDY